MAFKSGCEQQGGYLTQLCPEGDEAQSEALPSGH